MDHAEENIRMRINQLRALAAFTAAVYEHMLAEQAVDVSPRPCLAPSPHRSSPPSGGVGFS
jgi:hypothetical protein